MKLTKEQIIEWSRKAEQDEKGNLLPLSQVFERLAVAAYERGQEDMRERCVQHFRTTREWRGGKWVSTLSPQTTEAIVASVSALSIQKGGED